MFSSRLQQLTSKFALLLVLFATLAPSISHALAAGQGTNSFAQEICSSDGEKITIQVMTTQGQQQTVELGNNDGTQSSRTLASHLNHCPFCGNPMTSVALEPPHVFILTVLKNQNEKLAATTQQVSIQGFVTLPPPAQAPPLALN